VTRMVTDDVHHVVTSHALAELRAIITARDKPAPPKSKLVMCGWAMRFWRREFWTLGAQAEHTKPD
jgi:hypothetical protein